MSERKPAGMSYESWVEQRIGEAVDRGDFDGLPGTGRPLPQGEADEDWWVRGYLRREDVSTDLSLPAPLLLRREADDIDHTVGRLLDEAAVRRVVGELNQRVEESWRRPADHGPVARRVDAEEVVARWRENRTEPTPVAVTAPRTSWWRRFRPRLRRSTTSGT
ncbi:DUF1992 domain-containing protein [Actinoplanes hulinensis]|uniref:DUF1992 domain-containing protein n=1 Tax=Actinoplanes hulinensis TaxID=1144547 RepID=A0ABS7B8L6_9ACTN|nr:DUF1992 domain-containing protein [Actinoplanes hulinensis]MBW6437414.1 DUF1992 domain-containing protein [Actinoplanes hulinensis]